MQTHCTNPFTHLSQILSRGALPKPRDNWRLVAKPVVGQIQALPAFRGIPVATNGILAAILRPDDTIVLGHLGWFIPDEVEAETDLFGHAAKRTMRESKPSIFDEI